MNDYDKLLRLQRKRVELKAKLDVLDDQIRSLAEPMRAALKLPPRPVGRPRGSEGMDRVITFLLEVGPSAVGEIGDRLRMKRQETYKLVDRLKVKGVIRANEQGRYELVPGYVPGSEEDGTPARPIGADADAPHPPSRDGPR